MASNVFISYSRRDSEFVARLESALRERDKQVWLDIDDISPGARWRDEIHVGLTGCDGVVFVMTPESLRSEECGKEIVQAIGLNKRVVPVLHAEPDGSPVPGELAEINWVRLRPEDDFATGIDDLVDALDRDFEWVHEHTRLGLRAAEWNARKRERGYLLRGADLTQAERFLTGAADKEPKPTAEQLEYVAASRVAAKRFNQRLLGSVSVALVVAVALSVVAFIERDSARAAQKRAYSRQLAADAETQLGVDPELSVLLASRAYDQSPTAESADVLRQALVTSSIRMAVRPSDGVSQVALTPNGRTLVTTGRSDGIVRLWGYPGARALGILPGVVAAPGGVAVNPADGRIMVVDRRTGQVRVFAGLRPAVPPFGAGVTVAAWAGGGRDVVTGASDGTVALWRGDSGAAIAHDRHMSEPIVDVASGARLRYLAALTRSGGLLIYDLAASRVLQRATDCHGAQPKVVAGRLNEPQALFSPDERRLVTYGEACDTATLWNPASGTQVGHLSSYATDTRGATFAGSSTLVLAAEVGAVINPATGAQKGQFLGHDGILDTVASGSSGQGDPLAADAVSGGEDGTIRLWQASTPSATQVTTLRADASSIGALSLADGDRLIASVDGDESTARVWASADFPDAVLGNPTVSGIAALSPDGRLALGDAGDGQIGVFAARSGRQVSALVGSRNVDSATSLAGGFSAGDRVAYVVGAGGLHLWRVANGSPVSISGLDPATVTRVTAPAEGSRIFVSGRQGLMVIDALTGSARSLSAAHPALMASDRDGSELAFATGRRLHVVRFGVGSFRAGFRVPGGPPSLLALSADGTRIAAGAAGFLDVLDAQRGRLVGRPLSVPGAKLTSLAIAENGSTVAGGYDDLHARLWELPSDRQVVSVQEPQQPGSSSSVTTVAISRDGSFLLTAVQYTGETHVWDVASGVRLLTADGDYAGWSQDGRTLLTLGGPVESWTCDVCAPSKALRALARTRVTRGFTAGEAAKFLQQ